MKFFYSCTLVAFFFLTIVSCNKDLEPGYQGHIPDLETKVTASVSGFVTNDDGEALEGASVTAGTTTVTTDEFGYFSITNALVVKEAAVITVKHNGHFNGIRTLLAEEGKENFVRIQLLKKVLTGSVDATSGGAVSSSNGLSITLPASAVTLNGAPYSGQVNVFAKWIDPTSPQLPEQMPGNLMAVNAQGYSRLLETYGMVGVELETPGGDKLEVAAGEKATINFPLPASLNGTAPSSIPLWHFNEETGLWVEEGQASKVGNAYVGEVSHFSFWNCDVPMEYVELSATLHHQNGSPMMNVEVRLRDVNNPNSGGVGYTNADGYVTGFVPANTQLLMEFRTPGATCVIAGQTLSIGSSNVNLGTITLNTSVSTITVSGTASDCNGAPLQNGNLIINFANNNNSYYTTYPVTNGTYSFMVYNCNSPVSFQIFARTDSAQSDPLTLTYNTGNHTVPDLEVCINTLLPYDGIFSLNGFHDRVPYNYPYTNVEMHMVTVSPNTVAFYWPYAGDFGHPIGTDQGLSWYGPSIAPQITFDPVTNSILSVTNYSQANATLSLYSGALPTQNYYDPVTRKIYVAWEYNTGTTPRAFFDTLTYVGPR